MTYEKTTADSADEYTMPSSGMGDGDYEDLGQLAIGEAVVGKIIDISYAEFEGKNYETKATEQKAVVNLILVNDDGEKARISGFDSNIYGKQMIKEFTLPSANGKGREANADWINKSVELARIEMTAKSGNTYYPLGIKELE